MCTVVVIASYILYVVVVHAYACVALFVFVALCCILSSGREEQVKVDCWRLTYKSKF